MKIIPRTHVAFVSLLLAGTMFAQTETYTFLYKDGFPINLTRTNNHGVSVGAFGFGGILYKDGNYTLFPLPGTNIQTPQVSDLNDKGEIVGEYFDPTAVGYFLKNGVITVLHLPGAGRTTPQGLNNHGVVVGTYRVTNQLQPTQGFIYKDGVFTPVAVAGATFVNLWDVNDAGEAVGEVTLAGALLPSYSFIYREGVMTPIPGYPGAEATRVFSINKTGEMVGVILTTVNNQQFQTGFILRNGQFETFRLLGSLSFVPFGITDKGDVTGHYFTTNFEGTTFIRQGR